VRLRQLVADAFAGWPWLMPPTTMSAVTATDVAVATKRSDLSEAVDLTNAWVEGAWVAWSDHHPIIRARTDAP